MFKVCSATSVTFIFNVYPFSTDISSVQNCHEIANKIVCGRCSKNYLIDIHKTPWFLTFVFEHRDEINNNQHMFKIHSYPLQFNPVSSPHRFHTFLLAFFIRQPDYLL